MKRNSILTLLLALVNIINLYSQTRYSLVPDQKQYELTNHLGNVLTIISDRKRLETNVNGESEYVVDLKSVSDYYPGGILMPERTIEPSSYYYKHQGQESDSEVVGEGNSYFYKYRMSNSRLNRFYSVDPLIKNFPFNSAYAFSENRINDRIELEGLQTWKIGHQNNSAALLSIMTETGIIIAPDGIYAYAEWGWGGTSNISAATGIAVTWYPLMNESKYTSGKGTYGTLGAGEGLVFAVSGVESSGYDGISLFLGVGGGLLCKLPQK